MKSYAVVNIENGLVENAIIWDGVTAYAPPDGFTLVEVPARSETEPTPGIGWTYIDGVWSEPPPFVPAQVTPIGDAPNVIA